MKKLLIAIILLELINIVIIVVSLHNINTSNRDKTAVEFDTVINKVRIDSIHILITQQDCMINIINKNEKYEINKVVNSDDSTTLKLFKELVTK